MSWPALVCSAPIGRRLRVATDRALRNAHQLINIICSFTSARDTSGKHRPPALTGGFDFYQFIKNDGRPKSGGVSEKGARGGPRERLRGRVAKGRSHRAASSPAGSNFQLLARPRSRLWPVAHVALCSPTSRCHRHRRCRPTRSNQFEMRRTGGGKAAPATADNRVGARLFRHPLSWTPTVSVQAAGACKALPAMGGCSLFSPLIRGGHGRDGHTSKQASERASQRADGWARKCSSLWDERQVASWKTAPPTTGSRRAAETATITTAGPACGHFYASS